MTKTSKGGLALAKHIAFFYADNPKVMVILAGGSVSRGCADEYSDLEIGVFWAERPSVGVRQAAIKSVGGELWSLGESSGHEKWELKKVTVNGKSYMGTLMVSTIHLSVTEAEACLSGLNRVYYPTSHAKWMDWLIRQMLIVPPNLSERLRSVFQVDAESAWNELKVLVGETLFLVERQMLDIDKPVPGEKNPPHVNMAWAKKRWIPHPPYSLMQNIAATDF